MSILNTIPLSKVVLAATIDLGEDLTKVEPTFNHFAVRGFKKLTNEVLRLPTVRVILPVHKSLKTVTLPLDFKKESFVGIIDECGHKHAFQINGNITTEVNEELCIDNCKECNQALDICEKLEVTEEKTKVTINGEEYENITYKYLEGGTYYVVKKVWVYNTVTLEAEQITTKEFITEFDMLECGCIAPTQDNISKIETNCFNCYAACYAPCHPCNGGQLGSYKIFEERGIIQFDRKMHHDKIYLEYGGCLLKKDGVFHVLEIAEETLIYFIKFKANEHKKSVSETEKERLWRGYTREKNILSIILGRIPLSSFREISYKTPKFNIR